ncbi:MULTISPECIES: hypothetical protein [unclassified Cupriavidus]|uniref:hypothetical protein n=1 Tax=Cupriavidus sp. AcVe19-1a TaxID=2821359 RepID=UPI001FD81B1D|nr:MULTISPECIES: hypothetical protein [unclassified Cupriavidus]
MVPDDQLLVRNPLHLRLDVIDWRQPPVLPALMQKGVILGVVVGIVDQDVQDHALEHLQTGRATSAISA